MEKKPALGEVLETQDIAGDIAEIALVLTRHDPVKASGALAIALGTILATLQKQPSEIYPLIEAYHKDTVRVIEAHSQMIEKAGTQEQATFEFGDKKKVN